jgi:RNA polymerase sigma-54 factor
MADASMLLGTRLAQTASPAMQHSIRILQMSSQDFLRSVRQALDDNPFLEEPAGTSDEDEDSDAKARRAERDDHRAAADAVAPRSAPSDDYDPYARLQASVSLQEHLRQQMWGQRLQEREQLATLIVIESIADDGYLRDDVATTAHAIATPLSDAEIDAAIHTVQSFDPAGIGARDLSECLALQLRAADLDAPLRTLALQIVGEDAALHQLARRDYVALAARLGAGQQRVAEAHQLIRRLDPRPGERFASSAGRYIEPDVLVSSRLKVSINPAVLPRVSLNAYYARLMRNSSASSHDKLRNQLTEARWLLRHSEQRFDTLRRVAEAIVQRQRAFFEHGAAALRPLRMCEIADDLGLHMSTISRAAAGKFMATARGTREFGYFFSRELSTSTGGGRSSASIKATLREMIEGEPGNLPQSDVILARRLADQGIRITRRTVTKYRNAMRIGSADLRGDLTA